ncbi:hypothetical protein KC19_VG061600 [Ceratodon purpureus]|uniref:Uncharacterized protein n=1 Tax=Ceratodon purpureus TaxID=3225 RepID=A0A8T0HMF8_CERPU|nr:hypothetical protein KC19_VG061600 [Ceratodon purpureus]
MDVDVDGCGWMSFSSNFLFFSSLLEFLCVCVSEPSRHSHFLIYMRERGGLGLLISALRRACVSMMAWCGC